MHMHKVATAVVKSSSVVECGQNESVGVAAGEDRSHEAGTSGERSKLHCLSVEVTSLAADVCPQSLSRRNMVKSD